jgi:hypothetical protein
MKQRQHRVDARRLEGELSKLLSESTATRSAYRTKLVELADAGKIALLMERMLAPAQSGAIQLSRDPLWRRNGTWNVEHSYRLRRGWNIIDKENGRGVTSSSRSRTIRFELADMTSTQPMGTKSVNSSVDLVVCTNVMPGFLNGYVATDVKRFAPEDATRALDNLRRALKPGGKLLVDDITEFSLRMADTPFIGELLAGNKEILVTRRHGIEKLRSAEDLRPLALPRYRNQLGNRGVIVD